MNTYYIWQEGQAVLGPYGVDEIRGWIAEGRLTQGTKYSRDGVTWMGAAGTGDLAPPAAAAAPAVAEPSLFIRQGMNIQGPYTMTRIRGYVVQRRIQPYMLFSQDRIYWCGPEHIPGLLPEGYVAVPPPARPTAVPTYTGTVPSAPPPPPAPPAGAAGASEAPVGSITLTGYRLDEADMAPPSARPAPPPFAPPVLPPTSRVPGSRGPVEEVAEEVEPAPSAWKKFRRRR